MSLVNLYAFTEKKDIYREISPLNVSRNMSKRLITVYIAY